eukprot:7196580-Prymnesium_polylepis.1
MGRCASGSSCSSSPCLEEWPEDFMDGCCKELREDIAGGRGTEGGRRTQGRHGAPGWRRRADTRQACLEAELS